MNPTVVSEEPLTIYEAKKFLSANKKRDEELTIRGAKCEDYVNQFGALTQKAATELKKALIELEVPRLKEEHICKIIDLMPMNTDDIKVILSGYTVTIKNDDLKRIDDLLAQNR